MERCNYCRTLEKRRKISYGTDKTASRYHMETRENTKKMAHVSVVTDSQKSRHYDLPELQRNIPTKHILQNSIW